MRPINRGAAPDFTITDYEQAKWPLSRALGIYCSYCERKIMTMLAVEHIQPKGLQRYAHLINAWTNFLLGCVNCNAAKKDKPVEFADYFLPDRDNTFLAFEYDRHGIVRPGAGLTPAESAIAQATIDLVALNKQSHPNWTDPKLTQAALERWSQRQAAFTVAEESLADINTRDDELLQRSTARTARENGFFSIWMHVFMGHDQMKLKLINAFPGTSPECFDMNTGNPVSRPGGKI
jgi:uncharacterized protein (TIGR02646 family)